MSIDLQSESRQHRLKYDLGDFVLIKVHSVIISWLHLGQYGVEERGDAVPEYIHVPSTVNNGTNATAEGSSVIAKFGWHYFMVSMQVQYIIGDVVSLRGNRPETIGSHKMLPLGDAISHDLGSSPSPTVKPNTAGRLLRQRWTIRKETRDYIGCEITASYAQCDVPLDSSLFATARHCHRPQISSLGYRWTRTHMITSPPVTISGYCQSVLFPWLL